MSTFDMSAFISQANSTAVETNDAVVLRFTLGNEVRISAEQAYDTTVAELFSLNASELGLDISTVSGYVDGSGNLVNGYDVAQAGTTYKAVMTAEEKGR